MSVDFLKLDNRDEERARRIWRLLHDAYSVEAGVIDVGNFPPLDRTEVDIRRAEAVFYGAFDESVLVAVAEVELPTDGSMNIASFGVDPAVFRRGYGSMLLRHLLALAGTATVTVSTAAANNPGVKFYERHGFVAGKEWRTGDAIEMLTLHRD